METMLSKLQWGISNLIYITFTRYAGVLCLIFNGILGHLLPNVQEISRFSFCVLRCDTMNVARRRMARPRASVTSDVTPTFNLDPLFLICCNSFAVPRLRSWAHNHFRIPFFWPAKFKLINVCYVPAGLLKSKLRPPGRIVAIIGCVGFLH
jgi:hypothetical protein